MLRIVALAVCSRLVFFWLGAVGDSFLLDYDSSSVLKNRQCTIDDIPEVLHPAHAQKAVWDSVYYSRISACGYEYEQYHAFFPGLPRAQTIAARLLHVETDSQVAAVLVTVCAFALATLLFYRRRAALAACLMCISPSSVFLTYGYTEALFQLATFAGVVALQQRSPALGALCFAASCYIRSNGIINAGFLLYHGAQNAAAALQGTQRLGSSARSTAACGAGVALMLYVIWQVLQQGYDRYCHSEHWQGADEPRPYCTATGPSLYSFIQSQYWGVGFLAYYQAKQIPNFLLAAPIATIGTTAVFKYLAANGARALSIGGLIPPAWLPVRLARVNGGIHQRTGFYRDACFVFVVQLAAMLLFAVLCMHVQVTTRFLTTCPALYWYMAEMLLEAKSRTGRVVLLYVMIWAWIGLVLFPNFYPWT